MQYAIESESDVKAKKVMAFFGTGVQMYANDPTNPKLFFGNIVGKRAVMLVQNRGGAISLVIQTRPRFDGDVPVTMGRAEMGSRPNGRPVLEVRLVDAPKCLIANVNTKNLSQATLVALGLSESRQTASRALLAA